MATQPLPALIEAAERGEAGAAEALFTALYAELHRSPAANSHSTAGA